jgi:O-antigen/teichoic acid export membrane protein
MIARLMGKNAVGYVSWASTLSLYPLVICNAMGRIYLPAFSNAAANPALLRSRVEKSLRINASIAWPACAVLASLSTPIILYVFTPKWLPAQPLLYAYCVNAVASAVGVPLCELFFAQDDAWFNVRLCLWWTIPTWTLGMLSVLKFGLVGFAVFQAVLQSTWLLAFFHARKTDGLRVFAPLWEPLLLVIALTGVNLLLTHMNVLSSIFHLGAVLAVEAVLCGLFLLRMLLSWRGGREQIEMQPAAQVG